MSREAWYVVQRVLICGWGSSTFMVDLLKALDEELPSGSEVTLFNLRVNDAVIRMPSPPHPMFSRATGSCI